MVGGINARAQSEHVNMPYPCEIAECPFGVPAGFQLRIPGIYRKNPLSPKTLFLHYLIWSSEFSTRNLLDPHLITYLIILNLPLLQTHC